MIEGAESIVLSIILKVLDAFLVVDRNDIKSKLISLNGKLHLQNVKLKDRKICIRSGVPKSTFLLLSGSSNGIELSWNFASERTSYDLTLRGLRISLSFYDEESEDSDDRGKDKEKNKQKDSVAEILKQELQSLKRRVTRNIQTSIFAKQKIQDILDSFSIRLVEPRIFIKVPEMKPTTVKTPTTSNTFLSVGADIFDFRPEAVLGETAILRRPIKINLFFKSIFIDLIDNQKNNHPILEPFTYSMTARREMGMRFVNVATGYQIFGQKPDDSSGSGDSPSGKCGVVVYVASEWIEAIESVVKQFLQKQEHPNEPQKHEMKYSCDEKIGSHYALILLLILAMIVLFGWIKVFSWVFTIKLHSNALTAGLVTIVICLASAVILIRRAAVSFNSVMIFDSPSQKTTGSDKTKSPQPATIRVPLPYASIVLGNGTAVTLSETSVLGHVNGKNIIVSGQRLDVSSPSNPRLLSASGIRASLQNSNIQVNMDQVNEISIVDRARSFKPIIGAVVRFQQGVLHIDLNELGAKVLQGKERLRKAATKKKGHRRMWSTSSRPVDEKTVRIRQLVEAEIKIGTADLKNVAIQFEHIQVQKNRSGFRIHEHSFRGNDGVDFMLESNIASTRREAVQIGRKLQADFNLFRDVTRNNKFKDDHDCLYDFVDVNERRNWTEPSSLPPLPLDLLRDSFEQPLLPFPAIIAVKKFIMKDYQEQKPSIEAEQVEILVAPGTKSRMIELTIYVDHFSAKMFQIWNARLCLIIHPGLQREIHKFQLSMDRASASTGQTFEDWYEYFKPHHTQEEWFETLGLIPQDMVDMVSPTELTYFPYAYISPFKLQLKWDGAFFHPTTPSMSIAAFKGSESTSSSDLIQHLVLKVLGRTPGTLVKIPQVVGVKVGAHTASSVKAAADIAGVSHLGKLVSN